MSGGSHLIIGGDSLIGAETASLLERQGKTVFRTTRRAGSGGLELDLDDPKTWNLPAGISTAYLFAAITSTEECRKAPEDTARVNVERTAELAGRLVDNGAFVVLMSTSLVFDGSAPNARADAALNPKTEYGRQKALLEAKTSALGASHCVIRPAKVLAPGNRLLREWHYALRAGEAIRAFSDFPIAPLPLDYLSGLVVLAGERRLDGILQASSPDEISYAELAACLAEGMGLPPSIVEGVTARSGESVPEHVPLHATLDSSRAAALGAMPPPARETGRNVIRRMLG